MVAAPTAKSKIKSKSHNVITHQHPPINNTAMHQFPAPYVLQDTYNMLAVKIILARSKVKSRSKHNVVHLHYPTNNPIINFLYPKVSGIQHGHDIFHHLPKQLLNCSPTPKQLDTISSNLLLLLLDKLSASGKPEIMTFSMTSS